MKKNSRPNENTADAPADDLAAALSRSTAQHEQVDPDSDLHGFGLILNRTVEAIGVVALAVVVGLIFTNAAIRYTVGGALLWIEEMVLLLIPWMVASGLFLSVRRGSLIRIEYFYELLPPVARRFCTVFASLLSGLAILLMVIVFVDYFMRFSGDLLPYIRLPKGLASSGMIFGLAITAITFFAIMIREWREGDDVTRASAAASMGFVINDDNSPKEPAR